MKIPATANLMPLKIKLFCIIIIIAKIPVTTDGNQGNPQNNLPIDPVPTPK